VAFIAIRKTKQELTLMKLNIAFSSDKVYSNEVATMMAAITGYVIPFETSRTVNDGDYG